MKDKPVILVVDDQPQNIELLEAYLVPQGYEIVKAANGEEALGKLSGNQIDLILLDVMMPGMDGFEVTRRVRQDDKHRLLPIILVTILRETEDRVKGIEAGCDEFISYPVDKMELLARVGSLLKVKAYNELMSNYRKELESEVTRRTEELKHALENLQQEIIDRKRAEAALTKSEEKFRSIFENSVEGIFQTTPKGRFLSINQSFARLTGYSSPEELIECITDLGHQLYVNPEDCTQFMGLIEEHGIVEGYEVEYYRKDGSTIWVSINARCVRDEHGVLMYYEGTFEDIAKRKLAEQSLQQTMEKLRKSLAGTIQVVSMTVETRDPYTAGHQRKVSNLARTIAQEMGLSSDTVDTIRMAGIIHDIGKISVPTEILSKPGKITDIEMSLIKVHSQTGYDILKDVGLPYPIAEIVLQHHERLDGSGYPNGLKGNDILLEAQIISVADVVEAMASFRPYRPALGIEVALEEIEKNKGILYDEKVVEVCLKLFSEKGFKLE
ncbi:MAG: response regulator [Proteobacteria bacterium]|nr:response regulator [Pseudomonadota bacterium]